MSAVEKRILGEAGWAYLTQHFAEVNAFCAALGERFRSVPGEVFTFAPAGTTAERLLEFEHGGLLPENLSREGAVELPEGGVLVPVVSLIDMQIELLKEAMQEAPGSVCIADDYNPRWNEIDLQYYPAAFGLGEEVYHLLTLEHSEEEFFNAVYAKTLWHDVSAVCIVSPQLDATRTTILSELEKSAASAVLITCTAYDGEGFVAWRRVAT